jgi:hypothetical protein
VTFADSCLIYRDLAGEWGGFRLIVGGTDVTNFRGIPAQIASYQLTEPYSYGPAEFALPSLTQFEVDLWGSGELSWFDQGKQVKLKQVDASGAYVRTVWRGLLTLPEVTAAGVMLHCDGEASGRLMLRDKHPEPFALKRPVGRRLYDAFSIVRLNLAPYLGGDIGVQMDGRGMSGKYLDYTNALLASTIGTDGSQYTIRHRETQGDYHLELKDTTTVDFTAFVGAPGVEIDLSSDLSEQPTTVYGQGVAPSGLVWVNGRFPNLVQGAAARYPMDDGSSFGAGTTNADTDSGDGVSVMIYRLIGAGLLDRRDRPGGFDSDVTDAIEALQDEADLTVTGNMNPDTWDALFDLGETGLGLSQAYVAPLAQLSTVRKWKRSSSGVRLAKNPGYDPSVIEVDLSVDHGTSVEKSRARRYSKGVLHRAQSGKNWAGPVTLTSDVFDGLYSHTDGSPTLKSRLDIKPGMNMMLKHFDGNTQLHVAIVNVSSDLSVTLGVDTQARDAATLGEVIARNIESRSHPARQWLQSRRTDANTRFVEFSEVGGQVFQAVRCPANEHTVIPIIAGMAGSVARVRLQTANDAAAFALAITAKKTSPAFWRSTVGDLLQGTHLDDVSLNRGGTGYTSAPTVSFSGGGGSGAAATATVSGGKVVSLDLTSEGTGYQAAPNVTFSGGGGTGAKASAYVTAVDKWSDPKLAGLVDDERALLGAWGTPDQPCGYQNGAGGSYTGVNGQLTGDPVTGLFVDDGGFDYHTFDEPVLYLMIFPDRDTVVPAQRVLWETLEVIT